MVKILYFPSVSLFEKGHQHRGEGGRAKMEKVGDASVIFFGFMRISIYFFAYFLMFSCVFCYIGVIQKYS